ncbi:MAG: hypothetical protein F6K25_20280 [Okeania sp. SIO2G4]|nr:MULTISPECIES: peroxidase family protein [unclassified Okeania]NEP05965.1 hypothetical protein [Okeania sp. SIO4D6]NEP74184.1 hypothetical protein [Okeania sp. SIO2G5]NEP95061.1 hypothetical protein [Okeania sp. SIO2F5]NEQ92876.1 hypothetical protein [Okeania sp. SIO2G4]
MDIRVNQQLGLTSVHTLFVREHNRLAQKTADVLDNGNGRKAYKLNELFEESGLSRGDFIYESARSLVGAKIQTITYNEFLPLLLGKDALGEYTGYDETVEPGIFTEFSTLVIPCFLLNSYKWKRMEAMKPLLYEMLSFNLAKLWRMELILY